MKTLSLDELKAQSEHFDDCVGKTQGIDLFCSSSDWIVPAAQALMPPREPAIYWEEDCYWAFMCGQHPQGVRYLEPLEAMWVLGSPLIGEDERQLVDGVQSLCQMPEDAWQVMVLGGLGGTSTLFRQLVATMNTKATLRLGQSTVRLVSDLSGGASAFMGNRSKQFQRSLGRGVKKAEKSGIVISENRTQSPEVLYARIQDIESRSWKGEEGIGITEGGMHDFYQQMLPSLHQRGAHRILFAAQGGQDIAYIFGGVIAGEYRGLQFSYDKRYRQYGLGNLLQWEQIQRLCAEGIETYDLGMYMEYKERWADRSHETQTLLLWR